MSILSILNEIKNTSSTNAKKDILRENKNNILLQKVIKYALDPLKVYGYKKLPEPVSDGFKMSLNDALDALDRIASREFTGHAGRDFIASVLGSVNDDDAEVLRKVLVKNLDNGIQAKMANAVFGNIVLDESYMRCDLLTAKTAKKINFKKFGYAVSELKHDGQYLSHIIKDGKVTSTSRNSKIYDFYGTKDDDMLKLAELIQSSDSRFSSGVVVMGEALVYSTDMINPEPRTTGNGIIQKFGKNGGTIDEAHRVFFKLWDVVPYDAFIEGEWDVIRKERRELLENTLNELNSNFVKMTEYRIVHSFKEAFDYNTEVMTQGSEGTIIKSEDNIFKSHTSPTQLKVKLKMEVDLKIVGFEKGVGKRKGTLGSIILQSDDGQLVTNCGTGFTDKMLDEIWKNRDNLLYKIVAVEANDIVLDKRTKVPSLFLPVFVEIREDKDTADTYSRIQEIKESSIEVFSTKLLESIK